MASTKDIKVVNTGKGIVLQAKLNGKWHSVVLDKRKSAPKKEDLRLTKGLKQKLDIGSAQVELGLEGGPLTGTAVTLSPTRRVSGCNSDTSKIWFDLPMGRPGMIKIILHQSISSAVNMKIKMKTIQSATQTFESSTAGNVLWLICDGTYWYPLSEEITKAGAGAPTSWTATA
jgi:hypothetical protein